MLRHIPCRGLAALLIFSFATATRAQEYPIKFDRPETVGSKYPISASGESKQSVNMDIPGVGPQKQEQAYVVQLDGAVEILAVDASGRATRLTCTVTKCLMDGKPLFAPGTVITGDTKDGPAVYTVKGQPVDPKASEALGLVIALQNSKQTESDDAMFGTDKPQKVGASWPINAEGVAAALAREGMPVKKENIKGSTKLVAVKKVNGKDAVQLEAEITMDPIQGAMPDGSKIESGKLTMRMSGLMPVDPKARTIDKSMSMDMQMKTRVQPPGGPAIAADLSMTRSAKINQSDKK